MIKRLIWSFFRSRARIEWSLQYFLIWGWDRKIDFIFCLIYLIFWLDRNLSIFPSDWLLRSAAQTFINQGPGSKDQFNLFDQGVRSKDWVSLFAWLIKSFNKVAIFISFFQIDWSDRQPNTKLFVYFLHKENIKTNTKCSRQCSYMESIERIIQYFDAPGARDSIFFRSWSGIKRSI